MVARSNDEIPIFLVGKGLRIRSIPADMREGDVVDVRREANKSRNRKRMDSKAPETRP